MLDTSAWLWAVTNVKLLDHQLAISIGCVFVFASRDFRFDRCNYYRLNFTSPSSHFPHVFFANYFKSLFCIMCFILMRFGPCVLNLCSSSSLSGEVSWYPHRFCPETFCSLTFLRIVITVRSSLCLSLSLQLVLSLSKDAVNQHQFFSISGGWQALHQHPLRALHKPILVLDAIRLTLLDRLPNHFVQFHRCVMFQTIILAMLSVYPRLSVHQTQLQSLYHRNDLSIPNPFAQLGQIETTPPYSMTMTAERKWQWRREWMC